MKFVRPVAIGVGVARDTAIYVSAENKHLLSQALPNPQDLMNYRENDTDRLRYYLIDKGLLLFCDESKGKWYSVDLSTGQKDRIPKLFVFDLGAAYILDWLTAKGESLILYHVNILGFFITLHMYSADVVRGICEIEKCLEVIDKILNLIRADDGFPDINSIYDISEDKHILFLSFPSECFWVRGRDGCYKTDLMQIHFKIGGKIWITFGKQKFKYSPAKKTQETYPEEISPWELPNVLTKIQIK